MEFRALIFHQRRVSARQLKESFFYLSESGDRLSVLWTHTSNTDFVRESPYVFFSSVLFTLCSNAPFVEKMCRVCICACTCVCVHGGGGVRQHSLLDACLSPYTPPSCRLLPPPGCFSRFSWDGNLQQRLPSPHTRQCNAPT